MIKHVIYIAIFLLVVFGYVSLLIMYDMNFYGKFTVKLSENRNVSFSNSTSSRNYVTINHSKRFLTTMKSQLKSNLISNEIKLKLKFFRKRMTKIQIKQTLDLFNKLLVQLDKYNITYFAYGGTLIGIHRHHGIIPWDDDVDILVDGNQKDILKSSLVDITKTHSLISYGGNPTGHWKFFKLDGSDIIGKSFKYPYIDIFFFRQTSTHTFDELNQNVRFSNADLYPLVKRFLNGLFINTPCQTENAIKSIAGDVNVCRSPNFNHSKEHWIPSSDQGAIKCDLLKPYFSFVDRLVNLSSETLFIEETLVNNKTIIHHLKYSVPKNCTSIHSYQSINAKLFLYDI